jgi:hypothetical protein
MMRGAAPMYPIHGALRASVASLHRKSSCLAALAVAFLAALAPLSSQAGATEFPADGYRGAAQRAALCADGSYLVGFKGRAGAWIDQIQPLCAPMLEGGRVGNRKRLAAYGGKGGDTTFERYCPKDEIINATQVELLTVERTVFQVRFSCFSVRTGRVNPEFFAARPDKNGFHRGYRLCPSGELAAGMKINYGRHVNGLGLICKEVVVPAAAPATQPAPTPSTQMISPFVGEWNLASSSGRTYILSLDVSGKRVTGTFRNEDPSFNGEIFGTLDSSGREFTYTFTQNNGGRGSGLFSLGDGNRSISGGGGTGDGQRFNWGGTKR